MLIALGPDVASGRALVIQLLLIAGILGIALWLVLKRGARQLAVRRLLIIAFALFAVVAVMVPGLITRLANLVGVGRGTDLLLYATVVVLLGMIALQEARAKNEEKRTTYLARRLALDETEPASAYRLRALGEPPDATAAPRDPAAAPQHPAVAPQGLPGAPESPAATPQDSAVPPRRSAPPVPPPTERAR